MQATTSCAPGPRLWLSSSYDRKYQDDHPASIVVVHSLQAITSYLAAKSPSTLVDFQQGANSLNPYNLDYIAVSADQLLSDFVVGFCSGVDTL
jgi:hypothetical protein